LEYTAAGAVGVYSDVTPYKFQALRAKTDEEMIAHIEKLASDIDYRAKMFKKDYQRVKSQLFWENNDNIKKYISTYLAMFGQCL
jgi:glycosyltransferase involved in cell wall biosynthesis